MENTQAEAQDNSRHQMVQQRLEQSKKEREAKLANIKEYANENKVEEEDWKQIDINFNQQFSNLEVILGEWTAKCEGKDKDTVEEYFANVFEQFKSLREYIFMYTFAIPAQNFASYQGKIDDYHQQFNVAKLSAIPKKKFTFAKKG